MKIISTLGPISLSTEFLNVCREVKQFYLRINGSHLSPPELERYLAFIHRHFALHLPPMIYLDLQGNKLRIGELPQSEEFVHHSLIEIVQASSSDNSGILPIPYREIFFMAERGDLLIFQDGAVKMEIVEISDRRLRARVVVGGKLRSRCGVHLHNKPVSSLALTPEQILQIEIARNHLVSHLALSHTHTPADLYRLKNLCTEKNYYPRIVAKIESREALGQLEEITGVADELWFCRGDLGSKISLRELGAWQDKSIECARLQGKPIIIAGEVFQSLSQNRHPFRSEVVHFYHLQKQGVDGIVLSDETALGSDPLNALKQVVALL
ncbi:MAG: hypothetical protein Kow0042_11050 [Calditrichia bacterium]